MLKKLIITSYHNYVKNKNSEYYLDIILYSIEV